MDAHRAGLAVTGADNYSVLWIGRPGGRAAARSRSPRCVAGVDGYCSPATGCAGCLITQRLGGSALSVVPTAAASVQIIEWMTQIVFSNQGQRQVLRREASRDPL